MYTCIDVGMERRGMKSVDKANANKLRSEITSVEVQYTEGHKDIRTKQDKSRTRGRVPFHLRDSRLNSVISLVFQDHHVCAKQSNWNGVGSK